MLLAAEKREDRECWDLQLPIKDARHLEFNMIGFNGLLICERQFVIFASHLFINEKKSFLEIYKANK